MSRSFITHIISVFPKICQKEFYIIILSALEVIHDHLQLLNN